MPGRRRRVGSDQFGHEDSSRRPVFPAHLLRRHIVPVTEISAPMSLARSPPPVSARFGRWSARSHPFPEEASVVGAIVVVALAVVAVFSLSGGEAGPLADLVGDDTPETPEFAFDASKPKAVETSAKANHRSGRRGCASALRGRHSAARPLYTPVPRPGQLDGRRVRRRARVLLRRRPRRGRGPARGADGGTRGRRRVRSIRPMPSTLKVHVLLDPSRVPHAVEGSALSARGTGADGQVEMINKGSSSSRTARVARGLVLGAAQRREA